MTNSPRRFAFLVLGLTLVTVPLYAPALDVTGADYQYQSVRITAEDDRLSFDGEARRLAGISQIDCYEEFPISRSCTLEASLLNGTLAADHPTVSRLTGNVSLDADYRYVAFAGDGRVFRRTADWNGSFVLGLERVPASAALDDVALSEAQTPRLAAKAVETESVWTDDRLWDDRAGRVVETDDGYFVVYETGRREFLSEKPTTERVFEWIAVLFGLLLLGRR